MDAQQRSILESDFPFSTTISCSSSQPVESDDDFPIDLSSASAHHLALLADSLFAELDTQMPDLRAKERYQAVCDELMFRQISAGVA